MYILQKITNTLLRRGYKQSYENTIFKVLTSIKDVEKKHLRRILSAIETNSFSFVELRNVSNSRRRSKRQTVFPLKFERGKRITVKTLIKFASKQYFSSLEEKLFAEFFYSLRNSKKSLNLRHKKLLCDFTLDNLPFIIKSRKKFGEDTLKKKKKT